jgi:endonuclease-3
MRTVPRHNGRVSGPARVPASHLVAARRATPRAPAPHPASDRAVAPRRRRALARDEISDVIAILRREAPAWGAPVVTLIAEQTGDPFRVLISTILSLRTQDETTTAASRRLFARAATPQAMLRLRAATIARLIYPVGFYRTKARAIRSVCRTLLERWNGEVPCDLDALLTLRGVGRKTANLVLTLGFRAPGICVDTHVHRITNRLGYVRTRSPDETEQALRRKLPAQHWIEINDLLVAFGQHLCRPISPHCTRCPVVEYCPRRGVTAWR